MTELLFAAVFGYLVGSFPTAYLVVRKTSGKDIRTEGSGNVGGYNTLAVTGSKRAGAIVVLGDMLKGIAVSVAGWVVAPVDPLVQYAAITGALLGHNYPVWLKFKGGRGLATGAGAMFPLNLSYVVLWVVSWFATYKIREDILDANMVATLFTGVLLMIVPTEVIQFVAIRPVDIHEFRIFAGLITLVLIVSHAEVFAVWRSRMQASGKTHAQ